MARSALVEETESAKAAEAEGNLIRIVAIELDSQLQSTFTVLPGWLATISYSKIFTSVDCERPDPQFLLGNRLGRANCRQLGDSVADSISEVDVPPEWTAKDIG